MRFTSLVTAATLATSNVLASSPSDLRAGKILVENLNGTAQGCMRENMIWTLGDEYCGIFIAQKTDLDQGYAWKLMDNKGRRCGPDTVYQSCYSGVTKDTYYADNTNLKNNTVMGVRYASGLVTDEFDYHMFSHKRDGAVPVKMTWIYPTDHLRSPGP